MTKWTTCLACALLASSAGAQDAPAPTAAERAAAAAADKAEWDARKAELDFRNSSNPASGLTGKVDIKAGAGNIEANILATKALETAASQILLDIKSSTSSVVLLTSAAPAALSRWELFEFRYDRLTSNLTLLKQDLDTALRSVPPDLASAIQPEAATLGLVSLASRALSYGLSDYEMGGITTTSVNDETLSTAISAQGRRHGVAVVRPTLLPTPGGPAAVFDRVESLEQRAEIARQEQSLAKKTEAALLKKAEGVTGEAAATLNAQAAVFAALATRYDTMLTAVDTLLTTLGDPGEKNLLPLSAVVREKVLADALDQSGWALFVSSPASGGGYYTKKNLWTMLGGMPFYVAGGAVVNYTLVRRASGQVEAAGIVSVLCGYRRVAESPALQCDVEANAPDAASIALSGFDDPPRSAGHAP